MDIPVDNGPFTKSFKEATAMVNHIVCINNCAERGVTLMQTFNATTKDKEQLQYVLQVVEQRRDIFPKCDRDYLQNMSCSTLNSMKLDNTILINSDFEIYLSELQFNCTNNKLPVNFGANFGSVTLPKILVEN